MKALYIITTSIYVSTTTATKVQDGSYTTTYQTEITTITDSNRQGTTESIHHVASLENYTTAFKSFT